MPKQLQKTVRQNASEAKLMSGAKAMAAARRNSSPNSGCVSIQQSEMVKEKLRLLKSRTARGSRLAVSYTNPQRPSIAWQDNDDGPRGEGEVGGAALSPSNASDISLELQEVLIGAGGEEKADHGYCLHELLEVAVGSPEGEGMITGAGLDEEKEGAISNTKINAGSAGSRELSASDESEERESDLPSEPSQAEPLLLQCPHCNRRFSEQSAARHFPICASIKAKPSTLYRGQGSTAATHGGRIRRDGKGRN